MIKKLKRQEPIKRTIAPNLLHMRFHRLESSKPIFFQKVTNCYPFLHSDPSPSKNPNQQETIDHHLPKFSLSTRLKSLAKPRSKCKSRNNSLFLTGPNNSVTLAMKSNDKSQAKNIKKPAKSNDRFVYKEQYQTISGTAIGSLSTLQIIQQLELADALAKFGKKWIGQNLNRHADSENEQQLLDLPPLGEHSVILKNSSQRKYSIDSQRRGSKMKKPSLSELYERVMGEEKDGEKSLSYELSLLVDQKQEYFKKQIKVDCKQDWRS